MPQGKEWCVVSKDTLVILACFWRLGEGIAMNPKSRFFGATFRYLLAVICTMDLIPVILGLCAVSCPVQASLLQDQAAKDSARSTETLSGAHCFVIRTRCWRRPSLHQRIPLEIIRFSSGSVENSTLEGQSTR